MNRHTLTPEMIKDLVERKAAALVLIPETNDPKADNATYMLVYMQTAGGNQIGVFQMMNGVMGSGMYCQPDYDSTRMMLESLNKRIETTVANRTRIMGQRDGFKELCWYQIANVVDLPARVLMNVEFA